MYLPTILRSTVVTLTWVISFQGITYPAQAYSFSLEKEISLTNRGDPTPQIIEPTDQFYLVDPVKFSDFNQVAQTMNTVAQLPKSEAKNGYQVFSPSATKYEKFNRQVELEIEKGVPVYTSQQEFFFNDKVSTYQIKTVITFDGKLISTLEKIAGEEGPAKAAGITSLEKNVEILFKQGREGIVKNKIVVPTEISRQQVNQILQPLVERDLLKPLQVQGWVGTEVFLNLQEAKQHPELLIGESTTIGKEISLPNNLGASIYSGTGIPVMSQSQNKANIALLSLISVDGEPPETLANLDRGIEKLLAYTKEHPPSNLNPRRLHSSYAKLIHSAKNLEDLTQIFNQAGQGRGIFLNFNQAKDHQWLFTSVDPKSPHYIAKVFGKKPTDEQVRTSLHIKEILRASGIDYIQKKLGLDTEDKLSSALLKTIPGIHPDIARGVANYLTHNVSNPFCHDNGFCSDLNLPTQSALEVRTVEQNPEDLDLSQSYYFPDDPAAPIGGAGGAGGAGGTLGAGGFAAAGGIAGIVLLVGEENPGGEGNPGGNGNPDGNPSQPTEIPEPSVANGLLAIATLMGVVILRTAKK